MNYKYATIGLIAGFLAGYCQEYFLTKPNQL